MYHYIYISNIVLFLHWKNKFIVPTEALELKRVEKGKDLDFFVVEKAVTSNHSYHLSLPLSISLHLATPQPESNSSCVSHIQLTPESVLSPPPPPHTHVHAHTQSHHFKL